MEMPKPVPLLLTERDIEKRVVTPGVEGKNYVEAYTDSKGKFHPGYWRTARNKKDDSKMAGIVKELRAENAKLRRELDEFRKVNKHLATRAGDHNDQVALQIEALKREVNAGSEVIRKLIKEGEELQMEIKARDYTLSAMQKTLVLISSFRQEK